MAIPALAQTQGFVFPGIQSGPSPQADCSGTPLPHGFLLEFCALYELFTAFFKMMACSFFKNFGSKDFPDLWSFIPENRDQNPADPAKLEGLFKNFYPVIPGANIPHRGWIIPLLLAAKNIPGAA